MNNNYPQNTYNRLPDNQINPNYNQPSPSYNQIYNPNANNNFHNQYPNLSSPYQNLGQPQYQNQIQPQSYYQNQLLNDQIQIQNFPPNQPALHPLYNSFRSKIKCFCIFGIVLCSLILAFEIFSIFIVVFYFPIVLLTVGELITYCVFLCTKLQKASLQSLRTVRGVFVGFSVTWLVLMSIGAIILFNTFGDSGYISRSDIMYLFMIPSIVIVLPRFVLIGSVRVNGG